MIVDINKKPYQINTNEFVSIPHASWNFLDIKENLGHLETIIALINELCICVPNGLDCVSVNTRYGGFVPINISPNVSNIFLVNTDKEHYDNIEHNIDLYNIVNVVHCTSELHIKKKHIIYSDKSENISGNLINVSNSFVLTSYSCAISSVYKHIYQITNTELLLYIPDNLFDSFFEAFHYYIVDNELNYNNLINLCIMVKNAGPQFENMLQQNLHVFDKWTILDTGSTDSTIEIINKVLVGKKKGALYQEPFINFRDSRNRLLELAGKDCKFIIMIDDTYVLKGNTRNFLNDVRGDQQSDSFAIYIKTDDITFVSNRIIKSSNNLKYKYKIHEVIQDTNNKTFCMPMSEGYIDDGCFDFMVKRSLDRKTLDLTLLEEEINESPEDPRHYYYMAQTYRYIENWEMASNYYIKRIHHPVEGFLPEKINAYFELARLFDYRLNKPWVECEELYIKTYELDNTNQAPYYFIGIHYYMTGDVRKAFEFFQKSFAIGYDISRQFVTISTISFYFLPKLLVDLCYRFENFILGEQCAKYFLNNNTSDSDSYALMLSWNNIHVKLNLMNNILPREITNSVSNKKPLLCFVADGGFSSWTGADILSKGIGGSETYIIEMARYIQKHGHFNVIVFCKCVEKTVFENVVYIPIDLFAPFIKQTRVHTCIISRFSEYVPLAIKGNTQNVYLVLHDLTPSGIIVPLDAKLKKIFCLTEWHVEYFTRIFPQCKDITTHFYYGIDKNKFNNSNNESISTCDKKIKNKFIYSSFPNRGLLELLKMWPTIVAKYADASLDIYSDVDGTWVNTVEGAKMTEIRQLLANYKTKLNGLNIYYHGWVNKDALARGWREAEYWFYPCTFMETFCLTALEAALSKTIAITNGLAALQNTVGERGICIQGDATSEQWQLNALRELFAIMEDADKRAKLLDRNYNWATNLAWETQANKLVDEHLIEQRVNTMSQCTNVDNIAWVENIFEDLVCDADFKNVSFVKNKFWYPIQPVINKIVILCNKNNFENVLEIGPGSVPFPLAKTFVGCNETIQQYINIDIDVEQLPFKPHAFDFIYSRHTLEDIQNPDFVMKEIIRTSKSGYIETLSPLIEVLKGVDNGAHVYKYAGYMHHRYIIWSDIEKCEIYFLPKYSCIIDHLFELPDKDVYLNLVNNYPIYWNNYFVWKNKTPTVIMYKNGVNMGVNCSLEDEYIKLLNIAITQSIKNTNYFLHNDL